MMLNNYDKAIEISKKVFKIIFRFVMNIVNQKKHYKDVLKFVLLLVIINLHLIIIKYY